ncbi:MAG TPA: hypothetical protein PKA64_15550 [Myxococcota bacterium]|nr:hypothetical protein [Myxococcota bacterium]
MADERAELAAAAEAAQVEVRAGRYGEALAAIDALLAAWAPRLGADDPDIAELRLDRATVAEMAEMAEFGRAIGMRWDPPPDGG